MTNVNNITENSQSMDISSSIVEASILATQSPERFNEDADVQNPANVLVEGHLPFEIQDAEAPLRNIAELKKMLGYASKLDIYIQNNLKPFDTCFLFHQAMFHRQMKD